MSEATELQALRLELAEARIILRRVDREFKETQAEREVAILTGKYGGEPKNMGPNQADRDRAMTVELTLDEEYEESAHAFYFATAEVIRLEAQLDGLLDVRREREWSTRDHLGDYLVEVLAEILK